MTKDPLIFAQSDYLWLLLLLPGLVALRLWSQSKGGRTMNAFTSPRLRDVLVTGAGEVLGWVVFGLQVTALGLFIVALAQPRWGEEEIERVEGGRDVVIAIDTSRSMLANDLSPNRLTRAALAAQDLLALLPGDRVGLIAFAGNAYLQAPLTTDHDAVAESIQSLDFYSVPKGGSVLSDALDLAIQTFEKSPARTHGLILFSDGGDAEARIQPMIERALENRILIITIGVGTEGGSLIPNPDPNARGDYIRDSSGNVVQTKLESGVLRELATGTRGAYLTLGARPIAASGIVDQLQQLDMQLVAATETTRPIERFQWPLGAGMLLLMIAWMIRPPKPARAAVPALALASFLFAAPAPAPAADHGFFGISLPFFGDAPDTPKPEEALDAFKSGEYESAQEKFEALLKTNPPLSRRTSYAYGLGSASRETEKFDEAVDAFSEALKSDDEPAKLHAHQGLAHSLYDQGDHTLIKAAGKAAEQQQKGKSPDASAMERMAKFTVKAWQDSIKHFDAALEITPDDEKIRENRDFVQKRLDELQQMMEQQQQQQQQGGQGNQQQQNQGEGDQQQQQGQNGDQQQDGQSGKQPGEQDGQGQQEGNEGDGGDQDKGESLAKEGNENQKGPLPEGEIEAADGGGGEEEGEEEGMAQGNADERNEDTGFSANEARAFLRSYADDQKSVELRQQREPPANGKDW